MCVDIVKRLKVFMEHKNMASTQFADFSKIARPTISQLLNGRNRKMSNELIEKLHTAFPELNILWLMFGDGEMLVKSDSPEANEAPGTLFDTAETADTPSYSESGQNDIYNPETEPADNADLPETQKPQPLNAGSSNQFNGIRLAATARQEPSKKIQTIMVFYTDSSFEIFTPAQH